MIKQIVLTDFRNYKIAKIDTQNRKNVIITGSNGAGKTALLEAISMLGGDRGLRNAQMMDIARIGGTGGFSVFAILDDETEICICFSQSDTNRHAKIDGENINLTDLAKYLRIVWLTPKEDRLFVDSAYDRRTFFDKLVSNFDPLHAGRTNKLLKLLAERAFILKNGKDEKWLDALDTQIAGIATTVAAARAQYAGELNYFLADCAVGVYGILENMITKTNAAETERNYLEYLHKNRKLSGDKMLLDGPHKSDFYVFNKKLKLLANLSSTGQQKNTLLSLILAHTKLVYEKTGRAPLILLDEIAAHLDKNSRKKLFFDLESINSQVWMTGLDIKMFRNIPNSLFVACASGKINNILT